MYKNYILIILVVILSSCAGIYNKVAPTTLRFSSPVDSDGVIISYNYDVLRHTNNKRYRKKCEKKGVDIIAIKITNGRGKEIIIDENAFIYEDKSKLGLLSPSETIGIIKQHPVPYMLHLLWSFMTLEITNNSGTNVIPIGLFIGIPVAIINTAVAGSANKNLGKDLVNFSLLNRRIAPGETFVGLTGVRNFDHLPLNVKVLDRSFE